MSQYFPKPYEPFGGDITVKLNLSINATKADIKNVSHIDTSSFALKTNLANLKSRVDKLDIDKLVSVPVDLSKLNDIVKNDVIKKTEYDAKIADIEGKIPDISNLATENALNTVENKIADTSGLVKKTDQNAKITDLENKITDISNLATEAALTAVENKIPNFSGLGTKTSLTAVENKIPDISNLATKTALTNVNNIVLDINTLIKKVTMTQKLQTLNANMLVILDLFQNQQKQMLLQKETLMQNLFSLKIT